MKTQIEVAIAYGLCTCDEDYINRGLTAPDCPWHSRAISEAMDEYAKQQAIEFFKWNARSISEYMDYLKRAHNSEGMEEMELELNHFESNSIEGRYNLFIESQNK